MLRQYLYPCVEHRTSIAEVMGSNAVGAFEFFLGFIRKKDSFRVPDMNFDQKKKVGVTESHLVTTVTRISWFIKHSI